MASNDQAKSDPAKQAERAQQDSQRLMEKEAQAEMERRLKEVEQRDDLTDAQKEVERERIQGTEGTPRGMGRAYESRASGSAQTFGKASATKAGGDPVTSPVIGNPGEARADAGNYDYAIAAKFGNPRALTQPLQSAEVAGGPGARKAGAKAVRHPMRVVALRKGEYNGIKEEGEEFDNDRNLPCWPEDAKSWMRAADDGEHQEVVKRAETRTKQQADQDKALEEEVRQEVIRRKAQLGQLKA